MKTAIELITAERKRQIEKEGWTKDHDIKKHYDGALALAAACYAAHPVKMYCKEIFASGVSFKQVIPFGEYHIEKKHNEIRRLTIAGALIIAEIERLQANKK